MNKLMARIVAVVLAVMMLGTVSFADPTATKDAITTDFGAQDMYTVKATKADGSFLAMYQSATKPTSILIDSTKVKAGETITVEYGGVAGSYAKYPVTVTGEDIANGTVNVATEYTDNKGNVYENVAVAYNEFTLTGVATEIGYKCQAFGGKYGNGSNIVTIPFTDGTKLSGGGKFSFEVILLAVPEGVRVEATPYILY